MNAPLSDLALKIVLAFLTFCSAALLLRDALAIGLHVPLDPNEGWNAYHAMAAMAGHGLYPHGLMFNNYPPLSFYIVGVLAKITGDGIVAGRLLSLIAFLAIGMGLAALLRQIGARVLDGLFAALFFGAALLIVSDYVAMDDPQMLGHAFQIQALLLLLRQRPDTIWSAMLFAVSLFIKHNLIAMPLAATVWLLGQDRGAGIRFLGAGLVLGLCGLTAAWVLLGVNLPTELASARVSSFANAQGAILRFLSWSAPAILGMAFLAVQRRPDKWARFCLLYTGFSLAIGMALSAGDGVDANIFFDATIALALSGGLALSRVPPFGRGLVALLYAAPLALFLARNVRDANFPYTEPFQRQAPIDIAFLKIRPGPALCESLSLCYWAGKAAGVDVFNLSERFKTGAQDEISLIALLQRQYFGVIQFDSLSPFAFSAKVAAALSANYRTEREDENGVFLVPRGKASSATSPS